MRAPFSSSPSVPVHACKRRSKPSPTPRACATGATRSRSPHPTPRTRLPHATRRTYERPRAVPRAAADPTDPSRGRRARHGRALPALPASRRWRGADGSFENKAKGPPAGGDRDRRISREARARGDRAPRPGRVGLGRCAVTACLMRGGGRPGRLAKWRGALAPRTCHPRNLVAYSCWGAGAVTCRATDRYAGVHSTSIKCIWVVRRRSNPTDTGGVRCNTPPSYGALQLASNFFRPAAIGLTLAQLCIGAEHLLR